MPTNTKLWLDFAIQQMAAESYLDQFVVQGVQLQQVLVDGNNDRRVIPSDQFTGKTRFADLQAQQFVQHYQVIDHHASDATGSSATLLFDTANNSYTLSFRSTEHQNQVQGGDWERDGVAGADGEILRYGFALAQLVSMERYYQELKTSGKLSVGATLNVTGYSLGGHLATVFTELHEADITHTYTFNGAGRGTIVEQGQIGQPEVQSIRRILQDMDAQIQTFDPNGELFRSGAAGNIYQDDRYQNALIATRQAFTTVGTSVIVSTSINQGAFAKVTQLHGRAVTGSDFEFVANSGIHATPIPVLIEGQPIHGGRDDQGQLQVGNAHSLTLLVDSLALMDFFQTIDPRRTQAEVESILKASSDAKAQAVVPSPDTPNAAEGDTLEQALDALRKLFLGPTVTPATLPVDSRGGGFGNITNREAFYTGLAAVKTALNGQTYRITSLVHQPTETVKGNALLPNDTGLAYRYALKELNPFVVVGANYDPHNADGALDLSDLSTGTGVLTLEYLADRATFLNNTLVLNTHNGPSLVDQVNGIHWKDYASGYEIHPAALFSFTPRQFLFGATADDSLTGGIFVDHLYGGAGNDTLHGGKSGDYLEGNQGNDILDGGTGADRMVGGAGDDTYIIDNIGDRVTEAANSGIDTVHTSLNYALGANIENLTLTGDEPIAALGNELSNVIIGNSALNRIEGGRGTDFLFGAGGDDVYIYHTGDGIDTIEDKQGQNSILFDGIKLQSGIRRSGDTADTYTTPDGRFTYRFFNGDLLVNNGQLILNEDFQSGEFGIRLIEEADYSNGQAEFPFTFGDADDTFASGGAAGNLLLHMGGGNDYVLAGQHNDQAFGEAGDDTLFGNSADDRLYGGSGNDFLAGDNDDPSVTDGDDLLEGAEGDDQLVGGWGNDLLYGGAGIDTLYGDTTGKTQEGYTADDYLDGGDGNDELHGLAGDDVLYGGAGNDFLSGEEGDDIEDGGDGDDLLLAYTGNDTLSGGQGLDTLYGDVGDDLLDGGSEHDEIYGGDGADTLFSGSGDDVLFGDFLNNPSQASLMGGNDFLDGDDGNDHLEGGIGEDTLAGGTGNDVLFGQDGNDALLGDDGADELQGGIGNDLLSGDAGNDTLFGDEGDDTIYGGDGVDYLEGNTGDDVLDGGDGSDTYVFNLGDGHDAIADRAMTGETNIIQFGSGITRGNLALTPDQTAGTLTIHVGANDSIRLDNFDLNNVTGTSVVQMLTFADGSRIALADLLPLPSGYVLGTEVDDDIQTGSNDDVTDTGNGNDAVYAGEGADTLFGGAGDDQLFGEAGDDVLDGGVGGDTLYGGSGSDTYVFGLGSGVDTIEEDDYLGTDVDTVQIGAGIRPEDVMLRGSRLENSYSLDLSLVISGTNDELRVSGFFDDPSYRIDRIAFADGTMWEESTILDKALAEGFHITASSDEGTYVEGTEFHDVLTGRSGDDTLDAYEGTDILRGEGGDDELFGGEGNDALFGGPGNDTLNGQEGADSMTGGTGDDTYEINEIGDVIIEVAGGGRDRVIISELSGYLLPEHFEDLELSLNGLTPVLTGIGNDADNELRGNFYDNVLEGGAGNDRLWGGFYNQYVGPNHDVLRGGSGDDAYYFEAFNGTATIHDVATVDAGNRLQFGATIHPSDLTFLEDSTSLIISINGTDDQVILSDFDPNNLNGSRVVETVEFVGNLDQAVGGFQVKLMDLLSPTLGTDGDDLFTGTNGVDVIRGGAGDDRMAGGSGNDTLMGGAGRDTYLFNVGDGFDLIDDGVVPGERNTVLFGPSIDSNMLRLEHAGHGGGLTIKIDQTGDALHLVGFNPDNATAPQPIETFRFADGTELSFADLMTRGVEVIGTNIVPYGGIEHLAGTFANDRIHGLGGRDALYGEAGEDILIGGTGDDVLSGGPGEDTYVFRLGDGHDRIEDEGEYIPPSGEDPSDEGRFIENRVLFGAGITLSDLTLIEGEDGSTIQKILVGSNGDAIDLPNFVDASPGLRTVTFADGLTVDLYNLFEAGLITEDQIIQAGPDDRVVIGGAGNDTMTAGAAASVSLIGGSGNDTLTGGAGVGRFYGGAGNDLLIGGEGGNVFL
ncbi:MAG TPA: calcium-binding protein, partial [Nitrospiraceae bacterium]|nr:calcium-binding protein [Nitrospiraceae bacterium]